MTDDAFSPLTGRCTCGEVAYEMMRPPLIVHCCHCRWCQRETGASFALNALVEAAEVRLTRGAPEATPVPSNSGKGQSIFRCPRCRIALWSTYAGAGDALLFIRVGTLDEPDRCPPGVHIYTGSKQPWVQLDSGVPAFDGYYRRSEVWSAESLRRREALLAVGR